MNFDQGYRHAIQAIRESPFESDSQRESCEVCSGILEQLLEQFGPLRLLQLDIYEHLGIQDPIRNLAIIYEVAGDDYHRFLALAFPPYDFSLQYEEDREYQEHELANFQERPSAFDFDSLYSGSGATGSTDVSVLGSPKVASSRFRVPSSFLSFRFGLFEIIFSLSRVFRRLDLSSRWQMVWQLALATQSCTVWWKRWLPWALRPNANWSLR